MMDVTSASEGIPGVSVCIVLEVELDKSVVIQLRTEDDTATGIYLSTIIMINC